MFTLGGLSGVMHASPPIDYTIKIHISLLLTSTTFYGGAVMALFGGLFYWWPKVFGRDVK